MKSSQEDLRRRGWVSPEEAERTKQMSEAQLLELLHSENAVMRTAAACSLQPRRDETVKELLEQLAAEQCLYTKIAICECLEKGNPDAAVRMVQYLGKIGRNQHKKPPENASAKKSFPLPRDIIARTLGRMETAVFPVLLGVLQGNDICQISEALDAVGLMVYNHQELAGADHVQAVYELVDKYRDHELILWKTILCLSVFPCGESLSLLEPYTVPGSRFQEEAERSVRMIRVKMEGKPC